MALQLYREAVGQPFLPNLFKQHESILESEDLKIYVGITSGDLNQISEGAINLFRRVIKTIDPDIGKSELNYLSGMVKEEKYSKGDIIISPYRIHDSIKFLSSGLVRGYYINADGEEITVRFIAEGGFVTHYQAFLAKQASEYFFEALEDVRVLSFSHTQLYNGYDSYPKLERFGRLVAEKILDLLVARTRSFQFMKGEERYEQFLKEMGNFSNRISVTHLSSYLGLTRPSLSRIRSQIARK